MGPTRANLSYKIHLVRSSNVIFESANLVDSNADDIATPQRELILRHNAGHPGLCPDLFYSVHPKAACSPALLKKIRDGIPASSETKDHILKFCGHPPRNPVNPAPQTPKAPKSK
jgi:hypothetical protein